MTDGFEISTFAREFQKFLEAINRLAGSKPSPLRERIADHLGTEPAGLPVIAEQLTDAELPNLQLALDELRAATNDWELIGLPAGARHFGDFSLGGLCAGRFADHITPGPIEYVNVPIGVNETLPCVQIGLYLGRWEATPFVLLVVTSDERRGQRALSLEIVAAEREPALGFLAELRARRAIRNVYRGKVLSFTFSQWGGFGLDFVPLPSLTRNDLILPEGDLDAIEQHTLGIAENAEALRAAGRHLKRGLLLYGPPGTGKTLSVLYLCNRMPGRTTVLLNGPGMTALGQAMALARALQPSMVVLEDVDLIAQDRSMPGQSTNPLLFQLLNEMDGLADDADVIFVLTTNRVDLLEPALAARPGRIDQAVEIKLPDPDCRRRLFELYLTGLEHRISDLQPLVDGTDGVSAAFIRELVRRAALTAFSSDGQRSLELGDLSPALANLHEHGAAVLRTLLGAQRPSVG